MQDSAPKWRTHMDEEYWEPPPVMTVRDLARYLDISTDTLYRHIEQDEIPGFKLGNSWRFPKILVDKWIKKQVKKTTGH